MPGFSVMQSFVQEEACAVHSSAIISMPSAQATEQFIYRNGYRSMDVPHFELDRRTHIFAHWNVNYLFAVNRTKYPP